MGIERWEAMFITYSYGIMCAWYSRQNLYQIPTEQRNLYHRLPYHSNGRFFCSYFVPIYLLNPYLRPLTLNNQVREYDNYSVACVQVKLPKTWKVNDKIKIWLDQTILSN